MKFKLQVESHKEFHRVKENLTGENKREFELAFPKLAAQMIKKRRKQKDFHTLEKSQQTRRRAVIKEVLEEFEPLLKQLGLCFASVELKEIQSVREYNEAATSIKSFTVNVHTAVAPFRKPGPTSDECLYVKDLHSISDEAYRNMSKICNMPVVSIRQIKARRKEINNMMPVHENQMGVYYSMKDKLLVRVEAYFDVKYGATADLTSDEFRDFIIHVKLSADGWIFHLKDH